MQIQTTHATACWRTNQLHVASKLLHKYYTLDSSTPSPTLWFTHPHALHKHSHTKTRSNTISGTLPPEIYHSELALPRADRVHLTRLRCGHHTALSTYRKRIDDSVDEVCTHCSTNTHSLTHIMIHCPALTHIRAQHNISSPLDLWHFPANCLFFLRGACLLGQTS